jgi:hypothetical protein
MKKIPNPWKKILTNAQGAQNGWNRKHQKLGVNRPVKSFTVTPEDIERIFNEQGQKSKWLGLPIDPNDVFRTHYPLSCQCLLLERMWLACYSLILSSQSVQEF